MTDPNEKATAELFIGYINEMQKLLGDVWSHLRNDASPEAQELCKRIENLQGDGGELHSALGED